MSYLLCIRPVMWMRQAAVTTITWVYVDCCSLLSKLLVYYEFIILSFSNACIAIVSDVLILL